MVIKQNKWKEIVDRWEDNSTQRNLTYVLDSINRGYKNEPFVEQFFGLITAFVATIYTNAYSYDNLTRVMFARYGMGLKSFNHLPANEASKQSKLFTELLKTMPQGFKDFSYMNGGFLNVPDGTSLTLNKAKQFIDYIQSPKFDQVFLKIAISDYGKASEK
ncbi:MAG: hypothetical protein ACREA3_02905 [Nitrosotalea sp.]